MENFNSVLSDHHKAIRADGSTLVQWAVIEHNLLSVSTLYRTVNFENLGNILGISSRKGKVLVLKNKILFVEFSGTSCLKNDRRRKNER